MTSRKTIIFDFDGTLTHFRKIDNMIIKDIFYGHNLILFLDKVLWLINGLGIIGNSMFGLKIRLYLYSLFSFKTTKRYINVLLRYKENYIKLSSTLEDDIISTLRNIKKRYNVVIISNNYFAKDIVIDGVKVEYSYKKRILFNKERRNNDVRYIVGDNLFDDYRNSKNVPFIYVGKSKLMHFILKLNFLKKAIIIDCLKQIEDVV